MKAVCALFVLGLVAGSLGRASAADFKDSICPEATQYVIAVGRLHPTDPPQTIYDVTQASVNAYERCSKDKLSNGFREAQHYADTRAAGLAVVAARALIALGRYDDARAELTHWRPYVQQVVDWVSETMAFNSADPNGTPATSGGDHRPSMYKAAAKDIVAAIDLEIAEVDRRARDVSRPQAQSPAPVPSRPT